MRLFVGDIHGKCYNMKFLLKLFPLLLSFAVRWAKERAEKRILHEGVPLGEPHLSDARLMGVEHPERIRLLRVEGIPLPGNPVLRFAVRISGLFSLHTAGMALRYGIYVRSDFWGDRRLIAHECVHTAQYERRGGFHPPCAGQSKRELRGCKKSQNPGPLLNGCRAW